MDKLINLIRNKSSKEASLFLMRCSCLLNLIIIGLLLIILSSCATVKPTTIPSSPLAYPSPQVILRQDIIHTVAPGETLWRLSKIYDVRIEDIMQANNLSGKDTLTMGQKLLIPKASAPCSIIPLYPSNKWKYIIIHHSATEIGNALTFHKAHKRRGFIQGLGYHFVIDNGSAGKPDGYIEISPRWIKQESGAHCKVAGMNYKGIGICLVGNFNKEDVSEKQMASLVYLVNILRRFYNIPLKNIMGHGQVPGANTDCPGKRFPWMSFLSRLKQASN